MSQILCHLLMILNIFHWAFPISKLLSELGISSNYPFSHYSNGKMLLQVFKLFFKIWIKNFKCLPFKRTATEMTCARAACMHFSVKHNWAHIRRTSRSQWTQPCDMRNAVWHSAISHLLLLSRLGVWDILVTCLAVQKWNTYRQRIRIVRSIDSAYEWLNLKFQDQI